MVSPPVDTHVHRAFLALSVIALGALAACSSSSPYTSYPHWVFASANTCPPDRVTVEKVPPIARPPVPPAPVEPPPPEVAADPGRLAYWRELHPTPVADTSPIDNLWVARGCGHFGVYACAGGRRTYHCGLLSTKSVEDAVSPPLPSACQEYLERLPSCTTDPVAAKKTADEKRDAWVREIASGVRQSDVATDCRMALAGIETCSR